MEYIHIQRIQMQWDNLGNITLLIVEDDMFNRLLIVSLLSKYNNVKVIEAINGLEALDKIANEPVDIILLDIYMPKMNGFETLAHIQSDKENAKIPIMMLSSDEDERQKSLEMGVHAFIPKPFDLKQLEEEIYKVLVA